MPNQTSPLEQAINSAAIEQQGGISSVLVGQTLAGLREIYRGLLSSNEVLKAPSLSDTYLADSQTVIRDIACLHEHNLTTDKGVWYRLAFSGDDVLGVYLSNRDLFIPVIDFDASQSLSDRGHRATFIRGLPSVMEDHLLDASDETRSPLCNGDICSSLSFADILKSLEGMYNGLIRPDQVADDLGLAEVIDNLINSPFSTSHDWEEILIHYCIANAGYELEVTGYTEVNGVDVPNFYTLEMPKRSTTGKETRKEERRPWYRGFFKRREDELDLPAATTVCNFSLSTTDLATDHRLRPDRIAAINIDTLGHTKAELSTTQPLAEQHDCNSIARSICEIMGIKDPAIDFEPLFKMKKSHEGNISKAFQNGLILPVFNTRPDLYEPPSRLPAYYYGRAADAIEEINNMRAQVFKVLAAIDMSRDDVLQNFINTASAEGDIRYNASHRGSFAHDVVSLNFFSVLLVEELRRRRGIKEGEALDLGYLEVPDNLSCALDMLPQYLSCDQLNTKIQPRYESDHTPHDPITLAFEGV